MRRIRIGNDVRVEWSIKENDAPMDFANRTIDLALYDARLRKCEANLYVSGEEKKVIAEFPASAQHGVGVYTIMLSVSNLDGSRITLDRQAFELVLKSSLEGGEDSEGIVTEVVELEDGVSTGVPGASAYEIWLRNGHSGTEADFLMWLEQDQTWKETYNKKITELESTYQHLIPKKVESEKKMEDMIASGNYDEHQIYYVAEE